MGGLAERTGNGRLSGPTTIILTFSSFREPSPANLVPLMTGGWEDRLDVGGTVRIAQIEYVVMCVFESSSVTLRRLTPGKGGKVVPARMPIEHVVTRHEDLSVLPATKVMRLSCFNLSSWLAKRVFGG